jgi:predicted Zn-dependent peptidase
LYGPDTPYGHPSSGYVDSARAITLEEAKQFYHTAWRPDHAHLVVAGAITKAELDALLARHLGDWRKPDAPLPARIEAPAPQETRPRMILVDRADAPQAVVLVASPGVAAAAPDAPLLALVNTALGGSFTSRLNQNLREDKGWTYGARSAFLQTRGTGAFVAQAAVFTNVTAPALREMIGEIDGMAKRGLEDAELHKVRARDLTDLIETHETVDDLVGRLASLGILGLPSDHDAKASAERQQATKEQLNALAARYLDTSQATIIVVGPRAELMTQLRALDLGEPELWSPEGRPLADDKPAAKKK